MDISQILKNKALPEGVVPIAEGILSGGEDILFAIVGDLSLNGRYRETALLFTKDKIVAYDGKPEESKTYRYADLQEIESKRMYGNATLSAIMPDGERRIFFRYTYAVAALCDAAALFIAHVREGAALTEECAVMAVTFERALSVCPRCGRTLLHPGAECIMCRSKLKIVKQFSKYSE